LSDFLQIGSQQTRINYNMIQIHSQEPIEFFNPTGETDLIPIQVIEGNPVVTNATSDSTPNPSQHLNPGSMIYISKDIKISPTLYYLVVVTH
jgi:hypothetical protein